MGSILSISFLQDKILVLKNLALFISGAIIGILFISLIVAYFLYSAERVKTRDNFIVVKHKGSVFWNKPTSFLDALEGFYALIFNHFFNKKSHLVVQRDKRRARLILLTVISLLIGLTVLGIWLSFDLQYRVVDEVIDLHDAILNRDLERMKELDAKYHKWLQEKTE